MYFWTQKLNKISKIVHFIQTNKIFALLYENKILLFVVYIENEPLNRLRLKMEWKINNVIKVTTL
jgi:hypothetical protein